tara:strand:+ start:1843 stop:2679 length:837 start_codon:yes stop_codon:yes gene_type:complete
MNPDCPIYIISKGRWESRLTSKALEKMNVPYRIAVEPQEYEKYASVIDSNKILVLPFSNHGLGSYPARNFCWEHSIENGAKFHWVLDDNINGFVRLNRNERIPINSGSIFKASEDFVNRYENVAQAGFEYRFFAGGNRRKKAAFITNTRIFSCILIRNDIPYRWRLKYNEDADLSLRVLKDGWCTVMFRCFLQNKAGTLTMKGGNTEEMYENGEKNLEKSQMIVDYHPDMASIVRRYGRWHHQIDYSVFKRNVLKKKAGLIIPEGINEYGMKLIEVNQ